MEGLAEVDDLLAGALRQALLEVLAHLPIEGGLQGVLDGNRAPRDHEQMR